MNKMANTLFSTTRHNYYSLFNNFTKMNSCVTSIMCTNTSRTLYSKSTLGIDGFLQQKEKSKFNLANIADKFKEKMNEFSNEDSQSMIFTEDLKNMIHIADNDEDVELIVKMIKKFNQQNKQIRFGNFIFGPVVMRLFHVLDKPEIAYECFKAPEMAGFFDQLMSYQILMDLLYENQRYDDMLEAVNVIKDRQIEGTKYPRNIVVLAMAACYKMNSKESLEYALNLWKELNSIGHLPMRRATTFCAGLALNQGEPGLAMEIISSAKNQNYTTVRNIKVAALSNVGRVEDALPILKSVLAEDIPMGTGIHTFNKDVLDSVKKAILQTDNPDLSLEFNRLEQIFKKQGNISNVTLDDQLCCEIQKPPPMATNNRQRHDVYQRNTPVFRNKSYTYRQRPGLSEIV